MRNRAGKFFRMAALIALTQCSSATTPDQTAGASVTTPLNKAVQAIAVSIDPDMTFNILADTYGRVHPQPLVAKTVVLADKNATGAPLAYRIAQGPAQGTATLDGFTLSYAPDAGFAGSDLISIVANDGVADTEERTITFSGEAKSLASRALPDFRTTPSRFVGKSGTFAATHGVGSASVAYDATMDRYVMAFESRFAMADADCTAGYWGIGMAVSKDGAVWEQNDDMVIKPMVGTDYACRAAQPALLHDGGKFHLFFKMHKKLSEQDGIGYATSTAGKLFSTPMKIATGVKNSASAIKFGNRVYVYYINKSATGFAISREWSGNGGKTWDGTKNVTRGMLETKGAWAGGTPFTLADRFDALSVLYDANDKETPFKMLIVVAIASGAANSTATPATIGALFESVDGENWKISATIPVTPNPAWRRNPEILLDGGNYLLWYDGTDADGKAEIRFMTTRVKWPR